MAVASVRGTIEDRLSGYVTPRMVASLLFSRAGSRLILSTAPAIMSLAWPTAEIGALAAAQGPFIVVGPLIASGPEKAVSKLLTRSRVAPGAVAKAGIFTAALFAAVTIPWLAAVMLVSERRLAALLAYGFITLLALNQTLTAIGRAQGRPQVDLMTQLVLMPCLLIGTIVGLAAERVEVLLAIWLASVVVANAVTITALGTKRLQGRSRPAHRRIMVGHAIRMSAGDVAAAAAVTIVLVLAAAVGTTRTLADLYVSLSLLSILMTGFTMVLRIVQAPVASALRERTDRRGDSAVIVEWVQRWAPRVGLYTVLVAVVVLAAVHLSGVNRAVSVLAAAALAPVLVVVASAHFFYENRDHSALRTTNIGAVVGLVVTCLLAGPFLVGASAPGAILAIGFGENAHLLWLRRDGHRRDPLIGSGSTSRSQEGDQQRSPQRRVALRRSPLGLEVRTRASVQPLYGLAPHAGDSAARRAELFDRDRSVSHWAHDYAQRLVDRVPAGRRILIQSSMSPTGPFHVGNFRDTITADAVARAVRQRGRTATVLLSFDDYDPVRRRLGPGSSEETGTASRPLADVPGSAEICRTYIGELNRVGIGSSSADRDDRASRTGDAEDWAVHYQADRYRRGEYFFEQRYFVRRRAAIAKALDRRNPDRLFRAYCPQCGRNTTDTWFRRSRPYFRCRRCGAGGALEDLGLLKPGWTLDWMLRVRHEGIDCEPAGMDHCAAGSTMDITVPVFEHVLGHPQPVIVPYGLVRQHDESGRVSGSQGDGLTVTDVLAVMPPEMLRWLYLRHEVGRDFRMGMDLGHMIRWYDGWDRFTAAAASGCGEAVALWQLLSDLPPPTSAVAPLPFRRSAGLVQSWFYSPSAAASCPADLERLQHAMNWLVRWGRSRSWFHRRRTPIGDLVWDDRLFDPRQLLAPLEADVYHTAAWAMWGTTHSPPLSRAVAHYGAQPVVDAITTFRRTGRRPLSESLADSLTNVDKAGAVCST